MFKDVFFPLSISKGSNLLKSVVKIKHLYNSNIHFKKLIAFINSFILKYEKLKNNLVRRKQNNEFGKYERITPQISSV